VWRNKNSPQSIGSGIVVDGHLYMPWAGANSIDCIDPKTGKTVWRERQKAAFWGSIVMAGGKAYVTDQAGKTVVFKPNPEKYEGIAINDLGEKSNSTPAISDGQIFIRTFKNLYCIGE
jgi:outer membrane protein assembly factor BamB